MASVKDFSVEEKLVNLYKLQTVDSSIDQIKILRGELPMEVKDLEDEVQGLLNRQTRIEEEINGITEFIEDKKSIIKESEALLAKYETQSDNVKNNREFEAINKEIEMQGLEIKLAEKHIRDANEELADKVIIHRIDADTNKSLFNALGYQGLPVIIVIKNGHLSFKFKDRSKDISAASN